MDVSLPTRSKARLTTALGISNNEPKVSSLRCLSSSGPSLATLRKGASTGLRPPSPTFARAAFRDRKKRGLEALQEENVQCIASHSKVKQEESKFLGPGNKTRQNPAPKGLVLFAHIEDPLCSSEGSDSDDPGGLQFVEEDDDILEDMAVELAQEDEEDPRLTVALSYLDLLRATLSARPEVYDQFLDTMKDFKSGKIDTPGVIEAVSIMFKGYPNLTKDLNIFLRIFLPLDYIIPERGYITPGGNRIDMLSPESNDTILHSLSLKANLPESIALRQVLCQSIFLIRQLFINMTISEDRTGLNGSEMKARLCALRDTGVPNGRHLRHTSRLHRKSRALE
ncbi:Nn.00g039870.m01.CDS01 [Neocucurbitaria sp. VM-36]